MLKLRRITYTTDTSKLYTAFVAMTDEEFAAFGASPEPDIRPYRDRSIHVVEGRPTPADIEAATLAFSHVYGTVATGAPALPAHPLRLLAARMPLNGIPAQKRNLH